MATKGPRFVIRNGFASVIILLAGQAAMAQGPSEIMDQIKGATIHGTENGVAYVELLRADGSIKGKDSDGPYSGEWMVNSKGQVCLSYDEDDEDDDCGSLSPDGSRLTFASDGSTAQVTLARRKP